MYEMRAEHDTSTPDAALLWHVVTPGGGHTALCGRRVPEHLALIGAGPESADDPTARYCTSCMTAVYATMGAPA